MEILIFFTPTIFCFHGRDLAENFTGTFKFSRAVFKTFSREGSLFHGRKSKKFHGRKKFFHGKKKSTAPDEHGNQKYTKENEELRSQLSKLDGKHRILKDFLSPAKHKLTFAFSVVKDLEKMMDC